jgi:hypothetical protein
MAQHDRVRTRWWVVAGGTTTATGSGATSPRPVRLGARLGIALTADDDVVRLGAPPPEIQPVVDPADVARWRW